MVSSCGNYSAEEVQVFITLGSTLIGDDDKDDRSLPHVEPTTTEEFPYCRWKTLHIRLSDENSKVSTISLDQGLH